MTSHEILIWLKKMSWRVGRISRPKQNWPYDSRKKHHYWMWRSSGKFEQRWNRKLIAIVLFHSQRFWTPKHHFFRIHPPPRICRLYPCLSLVWPVLYYTSQGFFEYVTPLASFKDLMMKVCQWANEPTKGGQKGGLTAKDPSCLWKKCITTNPSSKCSSQKCQKRYHGCI